MITIEDYQGNPLSRVKAILNTKTGEMVYHHALPNRTPFFNASADGMDHESEVLMLVKCWAENPDVPSDIRARLYNMMDAYIDIPDLIYEIGKELLNINEQEYNAWGALMYGHLDDYPHTGWCLVGIQDRLAAAQEKARQKEQDKNKIVARISGFALSENGRVLNKDKTEQDFINYVRNNAPRMSQEAFLAASSYAIRAVQWVSHGTATMTPVFGESNGYGVSHREDD